MKLSLIIHSELSSPKIAPTIYLASFLLCLVSGLLFYFTSTQVTIQQSNNHTLIDSTNQTNHLFTYTSAKAMAYYPVFYIGIRSDTLNLPHNPVSGFASWNEQSKYEKSSYWSFADTTKMQIKVDTTFDLGYKKYFGEYTENGVFITDSICNYKAFPIFIYNTSDSIFSVGIRNAVGNLVREIYTLSGQWVPLEKPIDYFCATYSRDLVIEPNNILVAKLLRYEGEVKALFRLKYMYHQSIVYSNTFEDYVDSITWRQINQ
ncbi:hypothetical protein [Xanthocytophaga agilis]|uniref:Uncharacterized protein n=1 Tax=Xanthocytophaga agilis TaxID=3048010 RepID=A0AAE3R3F9_9BACT|nr:hypothetical protein [Xanthocytophaga agilis]MDJ1503039.1 hypothetical protein [Xanthocytophaga agilis]